MDLLSPLTANVPLTTLTADELTALQLMGLADPALTGVGDQPSFGAFGQPFFRPFFFRPFFFRRFPFRRFPFRRFPFRFGTPFSALGLLGMGSAGLFPISSGVVNPFGFDDFDDGF